STYSPITLKHADNRWKSLTDEVLETILARAGERKPKQVRRSKSAAAGKTSLCEFVGLGLFGSLAFVGVRRSFVLLALVGCCTSLGILSAQASIAGSRMPYWYRWACGGFDLVIAGYILGRFGGRGA